jgi:hypothetical protein
LSYFQELIKHPVTFSDKIVCKDETMPTLSAMMVSISHVPFKTQMFNYLIYSEMHVIAYIPHISCENSFCVPKIL